MFISLKMLETLPHQCWITCTWCDGNIQLPLSFHFGFQSFLTNVSNCFLLMPINTWRKGAKQREPGSFRWCPVTGPEVMGSNGNTQGSLWPSGNTLSPGGWPSTGTGCPGRLGSLHIPGDIQNLSGHVPRQAALGGPAGARGWTRWPPEAPPNYSRPGVLFHWSSTPSQHPSASPGMLCG